MKILIACFLLLCLPAAVVTLVLLHRANRPGYMAPADPDTGGDDPDALDHLNLRFWKNRREEAGREVFETFQSGDYRAHMKARESYALASRREKQAAATIPRKQP